MPFYKDVYDRLLKLENKNAFTILKEFCEKVKLKLDLSFIVLSDEKAPMS